MLDNVFKSKLSNVMTDNKFDRVVAKRKKGKLDNKNLWRVETGQVNIFKQKQERKGKLYNIVILVDESGSMSWDEKIETASETSVYLAKSFNRMNINLAIIGFNATMLVHKSFEKPIKNKDIDDFKEDMYTKAHGTLKGTKRVEMACNHDYDAIQTGIDMLLKRRGKKILLIFSDGRPNCDEDGRDCGGYDQDKHKVDKIKGLMREYKDKILFLGIGIMAEHVKAMYEHCILIDDLDDFKTKVVEELAKVIKRG